MMVLSYSAQVGWNFVERKRNTLHVSNIIYTLLMRIIRSSLFNWCKFYYPFKLLYYLIFSLNFAKNENSWPISRIRGKSSALEDSGNENPIRCNRSHDRRQPMENATFCGQDLAENGLFCGCYLWKCFVPRSVWFLDRLICRRNCKSLECWPPFSLCTTIP